MVMGSVTNLMPYFKKKCMNVYKLEWFMGNWFNSLLF